MKKFILFAMLLFATCLASAAVFVADSPPCVKHELSINDNYTNNVNVIEFQAATARLHHVVPSFQSTKVPEVTLIFSATARTVTEHSRSGRVGPQAVPTSLFNYQNYFINSSTSSCFSVITIDMPDITNNVKIYILNRQLALK